MRKKLLLLSTLLTACASSIFAQIKEVYSNDNNITYTYSSTEDVKITEAGQTTPDDFSNEHTIIPGNPLQIRHVGYQKTMNRTREIKLTVSEIDNYDQLPNVLTSFSRPTASEVTNIDLNARWQDFAERDKKTYIFTLKTDAAATSYYQKYVFACEKAIADGENIKKGDDLLAQGIDEDATGRQISGCMYYDDTDWFDEWTVITRTTGNWKEGNTYENCTDIYVPTTIGGEIKMHKVDASDDDNKVGVVTGLIDTNRFNSILSAKNYLNYDFTTANIVGTIKSSDVSDNHLAYFVEEANAEGDNIINGERCNNYKIADDGTEIKVYKAFNAKNIDYTRNLTAGNYYAITLPFKLDNPSDYFDRTSTFTSCNIVKTGADPLVTFTIAAWEANMPMLCKANKSVGFINLYNTNGIQVDKTVAKSKASDANSNEPAKFNGTYKPVAKEDLTKAYIVGLDGTFGRMPVNSTRLKPCRAYITLDNESSAAKYDNATIQIVDEDGTVEILETSGEATGIDGVTDGANAEVTNSQFVSVDGIVSTTPVKGLNIIKSTLKNGKTSTKKVVY